MTRAGTLWHAPSQVYTRRDVTETEFDHVITVFSLAWIDCRGSHVAYWLDSHQHRTTSVTHQTSEVL